MQMIYRRAEREDLTQIVNLVKGAFSSRYIDMMIWGCSGIRKYLADLLDSNLELCDISNYVAVINDKVAAVAQLKRDPRNRQLYLNYICTDSTCRRNNVASKLLFHSIAEESDSFDLMALDVFVDNSIASNWYCDLGFSPVFSKQWAIAEISTSNSRIGYISGLPQSDRCFAEYGFSQFTLTTNSSTYSVGLLGENYFRISDANIFQDPIAISTLAKYASARKLLLITENLPAPDEALQFSNVAETIHMNAPIGAMINRMKNKIIKVMD